MSNTGNTVIRATSTQNVRIFGREPALIITTLGALLAVLVSLHIPGFSQDADNAIVAVVYAGMGAYAAFKTRPFEPMLIVAVIAPAAQLLAIYHFNIDAGTVTAIEGGVLGILQFIIRAQVTPANSQIPTAPAEGPVA